MMLFLGLIVVGLLVGTYIALGAAVAATRTPDQKELDQQIKAMLYTIIHWPSVLRGKGRYQK